MREIMFTQAGYDDPAQEQSAKDRQQVQTLLFGEGDDVLRTARPRLLRLAQLRGAAPDILDDVVQETLLEAWKHVDRLQSPEGFHSWIDEICRNICRRYARKQQTDLRRYVPLHHLSQIDGEESSEAGTSSVTDIPDSNALDIAEALSRQDLTVLLNRALGALSGTAREVVELCYLSELPQREVARRLNISLSAVEARLHRARRQLRQFLSGPLRADAEAFGLLMSQEPDAGWHETRLWCSLCGHHRLHGTFESQPEGGWDLRMRCPSCTSRYGLSNVYSKGLIQLDGLRSFRPAWKRTMQGVAQQLIPDLTQGWHLCRHCGTRVLIQVMHNDERISPSPGPRQFWVSWQCSRCGNEEHSASGAFTADEVVYWSHPVARQFVEQHPRLISEPEIPLEYAGQPAIRFQITDVTSTAHLIVLAHRQTLHVLATF